MSNMRSRRPSSPVNRVMSNQHVIWFLNGSYIHEFFNNEDDAYNFGAEYLYENLRDNIGNVFDVPSPDGKSKLRVDIDTIINDKNRTPENKFRLLKRHHDILFTPDIDVEKVIVKDSYTPSYFDYNS